MKCSKILCGCTGIDKQKVRNNNNMKKKQKINELEGKNKQKK